MFCKLALKNVGRSLKDYSVYFLTLTFGVCVFYVFNSLESQWVFQTLGKSQTNMVETIMTFINVFSVFVSVVLACLILYANTFLMKRRKRELGTYFLLGLSTGRVSLLLVLETVLIGAIALCTGLLLGILASHGLGLLSLAMFSATTTEMGFLFSLPAVVKTVLYFAAIFLLVMAFTAISISRAKLLDLMQGGRRNEEMRQPPLWLSVVLFLLSAVLLAVAYRMLLVNGILNWDASYLVMLAFGTLGTLLFFRSLSGFLLRMAKSAKGFYYKGLNMFVLRQFNSRVHTTYLSNTVICLLLLLAIGITASSIGLNNTIESLTTTEAVYDATVMNYDYKPNEGTPDVLATLEKSGFSADNVAQSHTFLLYYNDPAVTGDQESTTAVALADYNAVLAIQGKPPMVLRGDRPQLATEVVLNGHSSILVVPNTMAAVLEVRRQVCNLEYQGDKQVAEDQLTAAMSALENGSQFFFSQTQLEAYWALMGSKMLVLYLGLYLGIMFLLTAAAVLALQQLSQAADNAPRYEILARLGAEKSQRNRSVLSQVALAFLLPLSLALVHAFVGMTAANAAIAEMGKVDSTASSAVTAGFLLLIYGAYFVATYLTAKRVTKTP